MGSNFVPVNFAVNNIFVMMKRDSARKVVKSRHRPTGTDPKSGTEPGFRYLRGDAMAAIAVTTVEGGGDQVGGGKRVRGEIGSRDWEEIGPKNL